MPFRCGFDLRFEIGCNAGLPQNPSKDSCLFSHLQEPSSPSRGREVLEDYFFEEGATDLEDSPSCGKPGSPHDACVGVGRSPSASAFGFMPFTSSTYALNTSATLHACAIHPHGRCGGSPSKISEM